MAGRRWRPRGAGLDPPGPAPAAVAEPSRRRLRAAPVLSGADSHLINLLWELARELPATDEQRKAALVTVLKRRGFNVKWV